MAQEVKNKCEGLMLVILEQGDAASRIVSESEGQ